MRKKFCEFLLIATFLCDFSVRKSDYPKISDLFHSKRNTLFINIANDEIIDFWIRLIVIAIKIFNRCLLILDLFLSRSNFQISIDSYAQIIFKTIDKTNVYIYLRSLNLWPAKLKDDIIFNDLFSASFTRNLKHFVCNDLMLRYIHYKRDSNHPWITRVAYSIAFEARDYRKQTTHEETITRRWPVANKLVSFSRK